MICKACWVGYWNTKCEVAKNKLITVTVTLCIWSFEMLANMKIIWYHHRLHCRHRSADWRYRYHGVLRDVYQGVSCARRIGRTADTAAWQRRARRACAAVERPQNAMSSGKSRTSIAFLKTAMSKKQITYFVFLLIRLWELLSSTLEAREQEQKYRTARGFEPSTFRVQSSRANGWTKDPSAKDFVEIVRCRRIKNILEGFRGRGISFVLFLRLELLLKSGRAGPPGGSRACFFRWLDR